MSQTKTNPGNFFEDFTVGQVIEHATPRTVTEGDRALYGASKGAIMALTMAMAADYIEDGIRFNCVNPGTADTPWVGRLLDAADDPAAERAALMARQPHRRLVTAAEIAEAIVYLASPAAGSTNGVALAVDGGLQNLRLRPRRE